MFFEKGDHTRPQFWSTASKKSDWEQQRIKLQNDIKTKNSNIEHWRTVFEKIADSDTHVGKSVADKAKIKTGLEKPKMEIVEIRDVDQNHQISSYTSAGGVTHIIVNTEGAEKHYLIHKSEIEFMEENGQSKRMVGNHEFTSNDTGTANDFQEMIANNYELHVGGDFKTFIKNSSFVQIEGDSQINVGGNIGLVSRGGNVNIIIKDGDCNVDVSGKTNIHSVGDIQVHTEANAKLHVEGTTEIKADKSVDITCGSTINVKAADNISVKCDKDITMDCDKFSLKTVKGFHHTAGSGTFKSTSSEFGGNVPMNAPESNAVHIGCFPGPKAGFTTPIIADSPQPVKVVELKFEEGNKTELADPIDPAFPEKKQGNQS